MTKRLLLPLLFLLAFLLSACEHKELCYHHPHDARVRIDVDWTLFDKEVPTGMTVMLYPLHEAEAVTHLTNTVSHAILNLPAGRYHSVVYNQSITEFGTLLFRGMERYETAEVYANKATATWYTKGGDERVVVAPEWLASDRQENLLVTPEMVERTGEELLQQQQSRTMTDFLIATHTPRNGIYTILVTIHVEGIYNLRSVRATLTGLAEGLFFATGKATTRRATQLLEQWQLTLDATDPTKGIITARISSFGLPTGHGATPEENMLELSLLLVDNTTILNYPFQVGDLFRRPTGSKENELELTLDLTLPEPLPDVQPMEGTSGGFEATVDDWGEEKEVEIEM